MNLKIVVVSAFYSEGMGYTENCLPRALARLGYDVHLITSTYNVYANEAPLYDATYRSFLGPPVVAPGAYVCDGYTVHRLPSSLFFGYVNIHGLVRKIRELSPHVVHSLEIASLQTFALALNCPFDSYKLFCETHQTMSVLKPYLKGDNHKWLRRAIYRMTRTVPTALASAAVEKCYAVTPDCGEVARRFYGVPEAKLRFLSLGADTETFHPISSPEDHSRRHVLRQGLGLSEEDIVCVYTGRFTDDKNPLLLAQAIDALSTKDARFKGLFIGAGVQKDAIMGCRNVTVLPFMTHEVLAEHYRAVDVGVWPRQESMSMIDAASSGLPIVVSNNMGEPGRITGNGKMYIENDASDLASVLTSFARADERLAYGAEGRRKMVTSYNWARFAETIAEDFLESVRGKTANPTTANP